MRYLFDTNAVINFISDIGDFSKLLISDNFYISFVTSIELSVGFKTEEEEQQAKLFIEKVNLLWIDNDLMEKTVEIRKNYGLKLPDSIIVASAIHNNLTLITSDKQIIKKAPDINLEVLDPLI